MTRRWSPLLALLVAWSLHARSQPPAPGAEPALSEVVEVRVVNVDAVVLDKKGSPVPGLGPGDFRLTEDGREVAISNFYAYGEGAPNRRAPDGSEPGAAAPVAAGRELDPLTVALYLDDANFAPGGRKRVLQDVRKLVAEWPAGARLMLALFRDRLRVVAGPTDDPAVVVQALEEWDRAAAVGLASTIGERRARDAIITSYENCEAHPNFCAPCYDNWEEMLSYAEQLAHEGETRTAVAVSGLADLVGAVSGLAGRKVVLYLGDGFEQRPGIAMISYVGEICADRRSQAESEVYRLIMQYDESTRLDALTAYANGNRVQFFTVDAAGATTPRAASVEYAEARFAPKSRNDELRTANLQNTLFLLANETGGKAIFNANHPLTDLQTMRVELDAGYSLGFVPDHPPTGRVHLLKVELVGKAARGHTVRYRRTYQDKALDARLADRLVSAFYVQNEENPLGVRLAVLESRRVDRRQHEVPVMVAVPAGSLLRLPGTAGSEDAEQGRVRLFLAAQDDEGRRTALRQELVEVGEGGVVPEGGLYRFVVRMVLREGHQTLAVGVRDEVTQRDSVVRAELEVPVSAEAAP